MKRDKADILFSRYIRLLSGGECKRCEEHPKPQGLHCAHWQGRGKWTTRYERDNCQALCYGCHTYFDHHRTLKDEFFRNILGVQRAQEIILLSNKTLKDLGLTKKTLKEKVIIELKEKIKLLENDG